jgi:hypothetical protein
MRYSAVTYLSRTKMTSKTGWRCPSLHHRRTFLWQGCCWLGLALSCEAVIAPDGLVGSAGDQRSHPYARLPKLIGFSDRARRSGAGHHNCLLAHCLHLLDPGAGTH